jgi:hypothetical protein
MNKLDGKNINAQIKYLLDPEWCAFGVDESKAAPEVFAGVADFSYQLKCMTPCKNIINLPSVGSRNLHLQMAFRSKSSGDTHKGIRRDKKCL